jgi:sugar phosphate isomerase/epimerase
MKLGCAAWVFSPMDRPSSDEDTIRVVAELGFDGIKLILRSRSELDAYWTPGQTSRIRDPCDRHSLTLSQFVLPWEAVAGFADGDGPTRERAFEYFERGCQLACSLGADTICTISPWPSDLTVPTVSPPNYWIVYPPGWEKPKLGLRFPARFDWRASWLTYVESIGRIAALARAYGLRFALENHANSMSPQTDSLLRLFDHVYDPSLGANLDIGFSFIQRESIPWAIHKLGDRLFHIHARDGDGLSDYLRPVGAGILDWEGIVRALKDVGYQGFVSMEWPRGPESRSQARQALEHLREQIARLE